MEQLRTDSTWRSGRPRYQNDTEGSGRSVAEDDSTRASLRTIAAGRPRYLFRAWDQYSGGDARLNTATAIIPSAFLNTSTALSFDNVSMTQLAASAQTHLQGRIYAPQGRFQSYFSSWSHSLRTVIYSFASAYTRRSHSKDVYLSMIDTDKIAADVVLLYVPAMEVLSRHHAGPANWQYPLESLAFEVIDGQALKIRSFEAQWTKLSSRVLCVRTQLASNVVEQALELGASYGPDYMLSMGVHVLTLDHCPPDTIYELCLVLCSRCRAPEDWSALELSTSRAMLMLRQFPDSAQAQEVMRMLAARTRYTIEAEPAVQRVKKVPRPRRRGDETSIDMRW